MKEISLNMPYFTLKNFCIKRPLLIGFLILITVVYSNALTCKTTNLYFDQYNTDNGLSTNHIRCILQDSKGYIWFGTPMGLIRFNGYTFTEFNHNEYDSSSIGKGDVCALHEDKTGNLWVGTHGGGLNLFNRKTGSFLHYYKNQAENGESINDNSVNAITSDKYNNIWIGTGFGGLNCLNLKTNKFKYYKQNPHDSTTISSDAIMSLLIDNNNHLWIGTWGGGLNSFDYKSGKFENFKFDSNRNSLETKNSVWTIYQDKKHAIWLGTWGSGLLMFNQHTKLFKQYTTILNDKTSLSNNVVLSIYEDDYNNFWIGTESGLNQFDVSKGTFSMPEMIGSNTKEDLRGASIYALYNDKQGIVWIGTYGQGIIIDDPKKQKFVLHKLDSQLQSSWVNCAFEDETGCIWIGTGECGIIKYDRKRNVFENFRKENHKLASSYVTKICYLDADNILFSTYKGLYQINKHNGTIRLFNNESDAIKVDIINFNNQSIFFIKDLNLAEYNLQEKSFKKVLDIQNFSTVKCFIVGKDSNIWIGTENNGVYNYNPHTHTIKNYRHVSNKENTINDNDIRDLYEDHYGNIWIGTSIGLNKLNPRSGIIKIFNEKDGLSNPSVENIIEDSNGNIWVTTQNGVSQLELNDKICINYTLPDGLPGKTPRFFKTTNGELIMTGVKGFSIFNPVNITKNQDIPPVIITDFKLFNKSMLPGINGSPLKNDISETKELVLNHKQSVITFSWVALNFRLPEKNQYAYKMEGLEKEWNYSGSIRTTTYTNLYPGTYTFHVKASNNDGIWNETGTSLKIIILTPFWRTWWFKVILLILLTTSLFIWYRRRVWRLTTQKIILQNKVNQRTEAINQQKEILQKQKEALAVQADNLQEANFLLMARKEELETAAEELQAQDEELYHANEELMRLNVTKDRLFSIVAHDLKNPFNAITGSAEVLSEKFDSMVSVKKKQLINNILTSSKSAYRLLENLLEWARSQTNNIEFKPETLNIRIITQKTAQLLILQANTKDVELEINISEDIHAFADASMTETIIRNLVSNAIKFTSSGGKIIIEATESNSSDPLLLSKQELKPFQNSAFVKITVTDNGMGIPAEMQQRLFHIDMPHSTEGTAGERGTGLGLILCREFAEKNNGMIFLKSSTKKGSTFCLYLHKTKESFEEKQKNRPLKDISVGVSGDPLILDERVLLNSSNEKYLILIVEDNPELRSYLAKNLSSLFQLEEASNGKMGVEKAFRIIPDVIISDVMMPEMDGFELCKIIKNDERTCHIPVILLTAKLGDENHLMGLEKGADDYLTKPFNIKLLIVKIKNVIAMQQRLRDRFAKKIFIEPSELPVNNVDEMFIKRAIGSVEKNMTDEKFNVETLSEELNMSYIQVYRKLNAVANISPIDFIRTIRLKRAAQLIEQNQLNINEICMETGFNNHSYFTKCFKKEFGVLPKDYLQKIKS